MNQTFFVINLHVEMLELRYYIAQIKNLRENRHHKLFAAFIVEFHLTLSHTPTGLQYT
jgi:hypothetical protein